MIVVTDPGLVKSGVTAKINDLLVSAERTVTIFDNIEHDPDKRSVEECVDVIKSIGAKVVVAVGGGSCLDVAKVSAALSVCGGEVEDYKGVNKIPGKGLPIILMPTTAGTGSEVSQIAVISDKTGHSKFSILSPHFYCDIAIVDPTLTLSCPAHVTAESGMDALSHAIEVYTSKSSVAIIDSIVLEAIRLTGLHLRDCVHNGSDLNARAGMSLAALYAGIGLGAINTTAVHALSMPLGGMFNVPHGLANAFLLPYVMEFNLPACEEKLALIAEALQVTGANSTAEKAKAAVDAVVQLSKDVGIPQRLRDIDIPKDAIPEIVESGIKLERLLKNNPREVTLEDAISIFERAY